MIDKLNLLAEVANFNTAGMAGLLDILPDPDIILNKKAESVLILDDIASDEQVTHAMMNRKNRVLLNDRYAFKAGAIDDRPSDEAVRLCDMLVNDLESITIRDVFSHILDAPFYGFSVLEIIWEVRDGFYHIKNIVDRPHEWFAFNMDGKLVFRGENNINGDIVPSGKFLLARHFPKYKNPYGIRLLSRCLWSVAFKKGGVKFFTRFLNKYGIPHAIGNAPANATREEKTAMANDLSRMVEDAVAVIPNGATVQMHSVTSNQADIFNSYIDRWDKAISKVIMGQTLTTEVGDTGSYAAANTHNDVADDIAKSDSMLVTSVMNELAWTYVQVNSPNTIAPRFSYLDNEDLSAKAELDKKLFEMGVTYNQDYFIQTYGIDGQLFRVRDTVNNIMPSFATGDNNELEIINNKQALLDQMAVAYAPKLQSKMKDGNDKVKSLIETCESLEELEDKLLNMDFDSSEIEELLKTTLINGRLIAHDK